MEVTYAIDAHGGLVPTSRIVVGRGLHALAQDVGFEAVGELLVLMGFVTANGAVGPSAADVASALGRLELLVRLRLGRLARRYWRGQPLLHVVRRPSGWDTFHPTSIVLGRREILPPPATPGVAPAGFEKVRQASREAYARPRADVEREIRSTQGRPHPDELSEAAASGPKVPEDLDERWVVERLVKEKVDYSLAIKLVKECGVRRCLNQLVWLPRRGGVKNKARYIVGAIQNDYAAPHKKPDKSSGDSVR